MSETIYHKDPLRPETVGGPESAPQAHHEGGTSLVTYFIIFGILMGLLALTVEVARHNLGEWNLVIWMSIAVVKALLVVLFFMHVIESSRLTKVFVFGTILWVFIMFGFTFTDYFSRGWLNHSKGWDQNPSIVDPGYGTHAAQEAEANAPAAAHESAAQSAEQAGH